MTATATTTAAHRFQKATGSTACADCGKSRNTKAHGYTPTRGAGRAAAEKLAATEARQQQTADTAQAAEDAVTAVYARFAAKRTLGEMTPEERSEVVGRAVAQLQEELTANADAIAAVLAQPLPGEEPWGTPPVPPMKPCDGTCCPVKTDCGTRDAIAAAKAEIEAAAAALAAKPARKAAPKAAKQDAAPGEKLTGLWVARNMVDGLVALAADEDPAAVSLAVKVRDKTPNAEGGRTIRLTAAELDALLAHAVTVQAEAEEANDGTRAMSARKLQGRLAKLMA